MLPDTVRDLFKIHEQRDDRGFSLFFEKFPISGYHIASLDPGAIRGNHVHEHDEILCVIAGEGVAEIVLEGEGGISSLPVKDDYHLIRVPSGVKHSIRNTGAHRFFIFGFSI